MRTSVALCTYNGEKFLEDQLDSILSQTMPVDEIVVCDDDSSDNTKKILGKYQLKFPELFKVIFNKENIGYTRNFEQAILNCNGDLIFLCDQDDIWLQKKVATVVNASSHNIKKNIFAHRIAILKSFNQQTNYSFWDSMGFSPTLSNKDIFKYLLFNRNVFPGMSLAISRNAVREYFPLKKINDSIIHDYELLLHSSYDDTLMIVDEVLALYREHENQTVGINISYILSEEKLDKWYIYSLVSRKKLIQEIVHNFDLSLNILADYNIFVKKKYSEYLSQMSFPLNYVAHYKNKYYYKLLDGIF